MSSQQSHLLDTQFLHKSRSQRLHKLKILLVE